MDDLYSFSGCRVREVTRPDLDRVHILAEARYRSARCPGCGEASQAVHSRYVRQPEDPPCLEREVRLELTVRRLYCRNPGCLRRSFVERLPGLIAPRAERTHRLCLAE